jgi:zinc protease
MLTRLHKKRQKMTIFSLLLPVIFFFSPFLQAEEKNTEEKILDNGLHIIVKVDKRAPVVLSQLWYHVGSSYETAGITGISHVLEHMMFKGTPTYPGASIFNIIAQNGGEQNAMTSQDYTVYYQEIRNDKLALLFKIESDRMQNLSFNEQDFEKELKVVQEERKMRVDNDPLMLTYEQYLAAAYNNNPYRNPIAGWGSDLAQLSLNDVKTWYHTWYAPNNTTLVVVGNVEPEAVFTLAKTYFGKIPSKTLPEIKQFPMTPQDTERVVTVQAPAKLPILYMGYPVQTAVTDKQDITPYALDVLAAILGGQNSSRLQKHLVRGKQIAGDIQVSYDIYARLPTLFQIAAIPATDEKPEALKAEILKEIRALKMKPISDEELNRVKIQVIAHRIYNQDSIDSQGIIIGSLSAVGLPYQEIDHYQAQINKVTPADIQAVAKNYLQEKNLTYGVLVPQALNAQQATKKLSPIKDALS